MQNFVAIGQAVPEIWQFSIFSKWRPSAILDLFWACLETPGEYLVVFITTKFRWNRCSSFDNMQVLIFNEFGLMPVHAPKMEVLGDHTP